MQKADTLYASIDLGGTKIAAALAGADGVIEIEQKIPTRSHQGPEAVLERAAQLILEMAGQIGQHPEALGMGLPGWVDRQQGMSRFLPNLPTQWRNVPVSEMLAHRLGLPVFLLNDARMATLGELVFGLGQSAQTMAFLTLGTGIGGGIAIQGRLHLGPLGSAGELGHLTIVPDGPLCSCGNRGCLEVLASGPAITARGVQLVLGGRAPLLHELVQGDIARITPREMAEAAAQGDSAVRAEIERAAGYIGIGIANVVTTLHTDLIVIGGSVAEIGNILLDSLRAVVRERVRMFPVDDVRIERSSLGNQAGILGGIALAARQGNV